MSGYSDDPRGDYDRDERGGDPRDDRDDVRVAKGRVMPPAIGLIVVAAIGLLSSVANLIQFSGLDAQFDAEVKKVEDNNAIPNDQKKQQVDMINQIRDWMKVGWVPWNAAIALSSVIILIGGIKLMGLSSPGLVMFASILSLVPCISGCCLLGLVFGIWAMVALGKPEVKAGFAAKKRLRAAPPDGY